MAGMTNYQAGQYMLYGDYTAYTPSGKAYFKKAGRYGKAPKLGAFVYFFKADRGDVGHVEIVTEVKYLNGMYYVRTVGGNTNADPYERDGGKVAEKSYEFLPSQVGGGNRIDGFGYPLFAAETCSAEQLISVARSQVGYVEKASNKNLDDFKANPGTGNWTKYGRWYGLNPAQWCAMFASWCAYTAICKAHEFKPTGWIQQDGGKWSYRKEDGQLCRDEWLYHSGRWYVFDGAGDMVTGWFRSGLDWYYLANDGGMIASQWLNEDGHSYYFTASGVMARSAYVHADKPHGPGVADWYYWVDEEGHWATEYDTEHPHLDIFELAE